MGHLPETLMFASSPSRMGSRSSGAWGMWMTCSTALCALCPPWRGLGADAGIEFWRGGGGWSAAGAGTGGGGLDLLVDGEEGVERAVDRGGIREVRHQGRVEDD